MALESILTVVNAHFGKHGKIFTYISGNWYTLIDRFRSVKFYSTEGLHTELLVRKNPKCQHYYIPVSGERIFQKKVSLSLCPLLAQRRKVLVKEAKRNQPFFRLLEYAHHALMVFMMCPLLVQQEKVQWKKAKSEQLTKSSAQHKTIVQW